MKKSQLKSVISKLTKLEDRAIEERYKADWEENGQAYFYHEGEKDAFREAINLLESLLESTSKKEKSN